jgi:hypothetical protein
LFNRTALGIFSSSATFERSALRFGLFVGT